jgi:hypothetical protein
MKQHIRIPLLGIFAIAAATAAISATAQSTTPTTDPAKAQSQPATATDAGKQSWSDLDMDKDGNLSATEASANPALGDVFVKADSNADGALTGDEYRAYLAANQDKPQDKKK